MSTGLTTSTASNASTPTGVRCRPPALTCGRFQRRNASVTVPSASPSHSSRLNSIGRKHSQGCRRRPLTAKPSDRGLPQAGPQVVSLPRCRAMEHRVLDGHNDLLYELRYNALSLEAFFAGRPDGHLDLPRARQGGLCGGLFAVYVKGAPVTFGSDAVLPP